MRLVTTAFMIAALIGLTLPVAAAARPHGHGRHQDSHAYAPHGSYGGYDPYYGGAPAPYYGSGYYGAPRYAPPAYGWNGTRSYYGRSHAERDHHDRGRDRHHGRRDRRGGDRHH